MVDAISTNSQAVHTELHELYTEIPYRNHLLPQTARNIIESQHETEKRLLDLLGRAENDPRAWHQATQLVQIVGTKLGYLVPTIFPDLQEDALASLQQIHTTFKQESKNLTLPKEISFTYLSGEGNEAKGNSTLHVFN